MWVCKDIHLNLAQQRYHNQTSALCGESNNHDSCDMKSECICFQIFSWILIRFDSDPWSDAAWLWCNIQLSLEVQDRGQNYSDGPGLKRSELCRWTWILTGLGASWIVAEGPWIRRRYLSSCGVKSLTCASSIGLSKYGSTLEPARKRLQMTVNIVLHWWFLTCWMLISSMGIFY